jgi:pullulanase-type alpha-1,6-glucosidase
VPVNGGDRFELHYAFEAGLALEAMRVTGGTWIELTHNPVGLSEETKAKFPHLADYQAFNIGGADSALVPRILRSQVAVVAMSGEGALLDATAVQLPGVLDDLYAYEGQLGVVFHENVPTLKLWAPTAQAVSLHLFDDADLATDSSPRAMTQDPDSGVWSVTGDSSWNRKFYLYQVQVYAPSTGRVERNLVTDPYSISLAPNSSRSQIVNLDDQDLKPSGWDTLEKPPLRAPEDIVIYELHVRDFSIADETVSAPNRGTYKAFSETDAQGMRHLSGLAEAGLTHVHLLPVFDIATINDNRDEHLAPPDLSVFPPDSDQQQAAISAIQDRDGYNWGYDPFHYSVPEGSYATDPCGVGRIREFRQMVMSLNQAGLRVVMDVVYNHTYAAGQDDKSVLDKVVPGYYHRLDQDGTVATSTCCSNTASEHAMMEKLMVDSLVLWARAYRVDGFRFDLMGHHSKANMLRVRSTLDGLTEGNDCIDGRQIYLYGEGWNFGEVANNARFEQATQLNMAGTGIGTFSDRLRDAARGGSSVSGDSTFWQGFVNGLYYDSNGQDTNFDVPDQLNSLLLLTDQIRVGLAGNLADYPLINAAGEEVIGADIDYNGQPAGYASNPQDTISYVESHDDQTLFDAIQLKAPLAAPLDQRVRMQNLGISLVALGQGIPFFHAGQDMLRSKSMDRDSFNSGDWFNQLDFSYRTVNWGKGLPIAQKNEDKWPVMAPLLANPHLAPRKADVLKCVAHFREMLRIRKSSQLFRLPSGIEINARVRFHNTGPSQIPGLIVMSLTDEGGDFDRANRQIVTLFNANSVSVEFAWEVSDQLGFVLHPELALSSDSVVKTAAFDPATRLFSVPGRTTAVFVLPRGVQP